MMFRGTVKKGVVVFATPPPLRDGTVVRVEPVAPAKARGQSKRRQRLRPVGRWDGGPGELDALLAVVQRLRDADLPLERDAWR